MKIQFKQERWVVKRESAGFSGTETHKASLIRKDTPFEIIKTESCGKRVSDIYVFSDGVADGYHLWLVNIPNEFYEVLYEN